MITQAVVPSDHRSVGLAPSESTMSRSDTRSPHRTVGAARVTVTVYVAVATVSSAVTVTVIAFAPSASRTVRSVPAVLPFGSVIVTLAPSSAGVAVTRVDDTSYPTSAA